jgi:NADH-quinone oxidoreductase subunit N
MYFGDVSEPLDANLPPRLHIILVVSAALMIAGTFFSLFGIETLAQIAAASLAN